MIKAILKIKQLVKFKKYSTANIFHKQYNFEKKSQKKY